MVAILSRGFGAVVVAALAITALYLSRFWIWKAPWDNGGLFGLGVLTPFGDRIRAWLGGTWLWEFDILIWGVGTILALSLMQIFASRLLK